MKKIIKELKNRKIDNKLLIKYGFILYDKTYIYEKDILNDKFKVIVTFENNIMTSKLIDNKLQEEYLMVDVISAEGKYVGKVKKEYDEVINDIINNCSVMNIFKSKQTKEVIKYVKNKYQDNEEYLWDKFPNNAVFRNKLNNKWYIAILTVNENKIDGKSNEDIEVIDLLYQKEDIENIVDNINIFPGYHMNKKSWITIKLDGSVNIEKLKKLIDNSHELSINKK